MVINPAWDDIFRTKEWGRIPGQGLILLLAEKFYHFDRKAIKVLDLGCGNGANTWYLAAEGYSTYGIDGSPIALQQTLASVEQLAPGKTVDLRLGDLCSLPYDDGFFEIVVDINSVCCNSREDMKRIYAEARRVLRPDAGVIHAQMLGEGTNPSVLAPNTIAYFAKYDELNDLFEGFNIAVDSRKRTIFNNMDVYEHLVTGTRK